MLTSDCKSRNLHLVFLTPIGPTVHIIGPIKHSPGPTSSSLAGGNEDAAKQCIWPESHT